jgi:hypothetical protein
MSSDFQSACYERGITPNDEIVGEIFNSDIEFLELKSIQVALEIDYNMSLSIQDIKDIMEEEGIDLGFINWNNTTPQEMIKDILYDN